MSDVRVPGGAGHAPVLVIEDDATVRRLLTVVLTEAGFDVVEGATGEDGIRLARFHAPALVVLDVHLPGVSGYETCRVLREEFGDRLAVMFMSGERTESFDRVGGLLLGADDYLVKPFACDELVARVRRLLLRVQPVTRKSADALTPREREVLGLLAHGADQASIATHLGISPKTVSTHFEHIFLKLGVQSRAQAVAVAYRDCLVDSVAMGSALTSSSPGPVALKQIRAASSLKPAGSGWRQLRVGISNVPHDEAITRRSAKAATISRGG